MKTTYTKLIEFNVYAGQFLQTQIDRRKKLKGVDGGPEDATEADTKVEAAVKDVLDQLEPIFKKYNKDANTYRRNHALEDPKTMKILRDERGNYEYSKAGEEELEKAIEDLLERERELDIDPCFVPIPDDFDHTLTRKFRGFVFEENLTPAKQLQKQIETVL